MLMTSPDGIKTWREDSGQWELIEMIVPPSEEAWLGLRLVSGRGYQLFESTPEGYHWGELQPFVKSE
jgi:hypothetical protein